MSYYQSVGAWLKELRSKVDHYEPLAIYVLNNDSVGEIVYDEDDGGVATLNASMNFGESRCVSLVFDEESADDLKLAPVVYERLEIEAPADVMVWRQEIRFECDEEESLLESEELINSIKIDDETPSSFSKPPKFPLLEEAVVVRKKTQPNAVRAKTFNYDLTGLSQAKVNEIKGVTKIVIGDELCAKINRQQKVVFEDSAIHVIGKTGQNRVMLKEQVELRPGIQQLDKKNVVLHDVNNVPIQLFFDTSKDARCFLESERLNSPISEKSSIKTKLLRLLGKRSSREFLVEKGIYKNETIFGNTIQSVYNVNDRVPEFLTKSIRLIEMPSNISQVGIYRTSGNLATIQKIRFEVDKGNLNVLDEYQEDVDVLTGALKLFFRELKEPLIPVETCQELLAASDKKPEEINAIVRKLPKANYETLMCLLKHLLNIVEYKDTNKMDIYNLTICWGPSLMFVPDNSMDIMTQSSNNSKVLDLLLGYYKDHVRDLSSALDQIETKPKQRKESVETLKTHKKSSSCSNINDIVYDVVAKIVELIEANSKTEGLYKKQGSQIKVDKISKKLAKGKLNELEKIKADIHDFAGALRKYVNDLQEPIVPKTVFEECNCDNFNNNQLIKQKLKKAVDTIKRKDILTIILRHMVRILHDEKFNKTSLSDLCAYWKNAIIKTNQDDKSKMRMMEVLMELYGDYRPTQVECHNPMPDVIKDIEAMGRFSRYENVGLSRFDKESRGEAKILEDKTEGTK